MIAIRRIMVWPMQIMSERCHPFMSRAAFPGLASGATVERPCWAPQYEPHFLVCRYLSPCKVAYTGFPHSGHRGSGRPVRLYPRLTCEAIFHRTGARENVTVGKATSAGICDHHRHGAADKPPPVYVGTTQERSLL